MMAKATFQDFLTDNPIHKSLADNDDAMAIFNILSNEEQIYDAIRASDEGRPALGASVGLVEKYIKGQIEKKGVTTLPLEVDFNRQAVGRMQQTILARFGYRARGTQKSLKAEWFRTASCYKKLTEAELESEEWKGRKWKYVATMKITVKIIAEEVSNIK